MSRKVKTESKKGSKKTTDEELEQPKDDGTFILTKNKQLLLEEYKLLNNYIARGSSTFWSRFSTLFSINLFLFSVCSFLFKFIIEVNTTSDNIPLQFWIYMVIILVCIFIGGVVSSIWYFITEKSSALNAFWNDRMRDIEDSLTPLQTQRLFYCIFTIKENDKMVSYLKDNNLINDDVKKELIKAEENNDQLKVEKIKQKIPLLKLDARFRYLQKTSISAIIRHIVFTIFLLWIIILSLLIIFVIYTKMPDIKNINYSFFLLLLPGILFGLYIALICKSRRKRKNAIELQNPLKKENTTAKKSSSKTKSVRNKKKSTKKKSKR